MREKYVVMSQRLAGYLMQRGFVLQGLGENHRFKGRRVFFFNDTPQLHAAMADYQMNNGGITNDETLRSDRGLYESS